MDILVRNESSDQKESFKHVFAGRLSSVSKIAKQLVGSDRKSSCLQMCMNEERKYISRVSKYCFFLEAEFHEPAFSVTINRQSLAMYVNDLCT